jgi:hypothetical protein
MQNFSLIKWKVLWTFYDDRSYRNWSTELIAEKMSYYSLNMLPLHCAK